MSWGEVLPLLVILLVVCPIANMLIWKSTVVSVQRMNPDAVRPWNWRVIVGPFLYYPWLNKNHGARRGHR